MVIGLKRYQDVGDLHFVTFSCFRRHGYLRASVVRDLFVDGLERIRGRYEFEVVGYVVMSEHVH
jgi:putative transposase